MDDIAEVAGGSKLMIYAYLGAPGVLATLMGVLWIDLQRTDLPR